VEIELRHRDHRAVVSPFGAALRQYSHGFWGYLGTENKRGGQGDVLLPFPGRTRGGKYTFEGKSYQLPQNDKDGPNAIHGFVRTQTWELVEATDTMARFRIRLTKEEYENKGYPFSLEAQVKYSLDDHGLTCRFEIRNIGAENAPVAAGFHPYFRVGSESLDDLEVEIPASELIEFGPDLLPTGKVMPVAGTPWDHRKSAPISDKKFNHCFTGIVRESDGCAWTILKSKKTGEQVCVWMDKSFDYLVVYTGDNIPEPNRRKALAIEPMTCATDALNHPKWGLKVLEPGQRFGGSWGISSTGVKPQ